MGVKEEFLRVRMDEMGVSQADLSRKTDIPPGTISNFLRSEDGIEKTSYSNVRKICDVLGVNMDDLERIGPDGKLPEPPLQNTEETAGEPDRNDIPAADVADGEESPVVETELTEQQEAGGEDKKITTDEAAEQVADAVVTPGQDLQEEWVCEVKNYVEFRLQPCCPAGYDIRRTVSVIPPDQTAETGEMYVVRLPGKPKPVLRKVWRMDDGLLLVGPGEFDETPRIIRPDTEGFSIVGKVVTEEDYTDDLC